MSTLTSSSSAEDVVAAYMDSLDYAATGSVATARIALEACRALLILRPKRVRHGEEEVDIDLTVIADELKAVRAWLANQAATTGGVRHFSLENYRA